MISNNLITEELLALKSQAKYNGEEMVVPLQAVELSLKYLAACEEELQRTLKGQLDFRRGYEIKDKESAKSEV